MMLKKTDDSLMIHTSSIKHGNRNTNAREMLSDGRGMLAEFNNPDSLADCINHILQNPSEKARMERETAKTGSTMYWDKVALRYTEVLLKLIRPIPKLGVV